MLAKQSLAAGRNEDLSGTNGFLTGQPSPPRSRLPNMQSFYYLFLSLLFAPLINAQTEHRSQFRFTPLPLVSEQAAPGFYWVQELGRDSSGQTAIALRIGSAGFGRSTFEIDGETAQERLLDWKVGLEYRRSLSQPLQLYGGLEFQFTGYFSTVTSVVPDAELLRDPRPPLRVPLSSSFESARLRSYAAGIFFGAQYRFHPRLAVGWEAALLLASYQQELRAAIGSFGNTTQQPRGALQTFAPVRFLYLSCSF